MEWHGVFHAVLALIFVIGLFLLTSWAVKYCQVKGGDCSLAKKLKAGRRLSVLELRRLDTKNTLVLLRCDGRDYLLLLGAASNLLLAETPVTVELEPHD